ncbi:MAG: class I SAM-dependent methyltransferase [Deltaproteobacteria bacterium]|nr:class I SAM-dependent methyltransferase [Deltaproteobacteria bacterium]
MVNVCSSAIWEGYKYISDSNGIWRYEKLRDVLSGETYRRLHVLTHPVWWTLRAQPAIERLKQTVEEQAIEGLDFYLSLLRKDGRYEHIAQEIGLREERAHKWGETDKKSYVWGRDTLGSIQESETRFSFGRNWAKFIRHINQKRIESSIVSIQRILRQESLEGYSFLDIGSGSGLSSLAAHILGASVHAFDHDIDSVRTSRRVLETHADDSRRWVVERGSVLDQEYMNSLGHFDVVYAWGVLHHTGAMWRALQLAAERVKPGGKLAIAIYNDQGGASRRWLFIKRSYLKSPKVVKGLILAGVGLFFELRSATIRLARFQNPLPFADWRKRQEERGMSVFHDLIDWVGGYPFEVAKPEEVIEFLQQRGFCLHGLKTCAGGHGCNEYLFVRRNKEVAGISS